MNGLPLWLGLIDWFDDVILGHRFYNLCCWITDHWPKEEES